MGYLVCEPFCNGALADSRFADQDRVVLLPAAQDLGYAFYFLVTGNYRVKFVCGSGSCEVESETVQDRGLGLGFLGGTFRSGSLGRF